MSIKKRTLPFHLSKEGAKALKKAKSIQIRDTERDPNYRKDKSLKTNELSKIGKRYLKVLTDRNVLGDSVLAHENPELVEEARRELAQSVATNSLNAYTSAWKNFTKWCERYGVDYAKPSESDLVLYIFDQGRKPKDQGVLSYPTLKNYLYGISHYLTAGSKPLSLLEEMPLLDAMMRRLHIIDRAQQADTRRPIFLWMLIKMKRSGIIRTTLVMTMLWIALLGREGLYRLGELSADNHSSSTYPTLGQWTYTLSEGTASLTLLEGKTNTWRQAIKVIHPIEDTEACAATALQNLIIERANCKATDPLFSDAQNRPITRKAFTTWLNKALKSIGISDGRYKGHSLRIGGATELSEIKVPDHLIQAMGRWRTSCYTRYRRTDRTQILQAIKATYRKTECN